MKGRKTFDLKIDEEATWGLRQTILLQLALKQKHCFPLPFYLTKYCRFTESKIIKTNQTNISGLTVLGMYDYMALTWH